MQGKSPGRGSPPGSRRSEPKGESPVRHASEVVAGLALECPAGSDWGGDPRDVTSPIVSGGWDRGDPDLPPARQDRDHGLLPTMSTSPLRRGQGKSPGKR